MMKDKMCYFEVPEGIDELEIIGFNSTSATYHAIKLNPLKPKQLKWEEKIDNTYFSDSRKKIFYEGSHGNFHYFIAVTLKNLYYVTNINSTEVFKTLDEAKKSCQDHYDKIFYEMIGGVSNETND